MATYTIYSDTSDGGLTSLNGSYSTASSGSTLSADNTATTHQVGQVYDPKLKYECWEMFISFDTSSVAGAVSTATLSVYLYSDSSDTDFTLNARAYDWGSGLTTADWIAGANLSSNPLRASKTTAGISTSAYTGLTSDSSFASNTANPVRLVLCSSRHEGGNTPTGLENIYIYSADQSGTSNDPKLTIVTADSDLTPVFANMPPRIPAEADY